MKAPTRKTNPEPVQEEAPPRRDGKATVFDIETCGCDGERLEKMMPFFEPDSRLKDPEKIAASIAEKREKWIERLALDWKTATVVLIGVCDGEKYAPLIGDEPQIIEQFFQIASKSLEGYNKVGGHNVKNFDFPMLINRARVLGVRVPEQIISFYRGKPTWGQDIFDTLEIFSFGDRQKIEGCGVDDICKAMGIAGKTGTGAEFPALWKADRQAAIAYNEADCRAEVLIAKACGFRFEERSKQ